MDDTVYNLSPWLEHSRHSCHALRTDLNILQLQTVDASYLLIEQGPEHGQRDVENQNAQHHLDLLDQAFLIGVNKDKVEGDGEGEFSARRPSARM